MVVVIVLMKMYNNNIKVSLAQKKVVYGDIINTFDSTGVNMM